MHFGHHGLMSTSALVSKEQQSLNVTCHVHKGMLEKILSFMPLQIFLTFVRKSSVISTFSIYSFDKCAVVALKN